MRETTITCDVCDGYVFDGRGEVQAYDSCRKYEIFVVPVSVKDTQSRSDDAVERPLSGDICRACALKLLKNLSIVGTRQEVDEFQSKEDDD